MQPCDCCIGRVQMAGMRPLPLRLSRLSLPVLTSLVLSTSCSAEKLCVALWAVTAVAMLNAHQGDWLNSSMSCLVSVAMLAVR